MPSPENHFDRAVNDKEFGENTCERTDQVWAVICYFYAAMHFVCACLRKDGRYSEVEVSTKRHRKILDLVDDLYTDISEEYASLFNHGWIARYDPNWRPIGMILQLSRARVRKIKKYSQARLGV